METYTDKEVFWDSEKKAFRNLENKIQSPNDIYEFFKDMDIEYEAGSRFGYSNSNYILLGVIIEKLSGKSYSDFLADHIFTPLNMMRSGYILRGANISNMAIGYDTLFPQPVTSEKVDPVISFAAGGICSCVNDLFKWSIGLFNGKVLTQESLQEMITVDRGDYGLGVQIENLKFGGKNYTVVGHNGGYPGFFSKFARILETRHTIILLCNVSDIREHGFECFSEVIDCVNVGT